jgi:hypothetical protein
VFLSVIHHRQNHLESNSAVFRYILFTHEAGFPRDGIVKFHTPHVYVDNNPHPTVVSIHQLRFSINVWVGILCGQFFGLVVSPITLTDAVDFFLVKDLPVLVEHVPLHQLQHTWFKYYGTPPHFLRNVRQHLNHTFGKQ